MRNVSFSDGGLRDGDIIIRDKKDLVSCFLGCVVSPSPCNWVGVFFSFPPVLAFFHDQTHALTQTRKVRRHAERPKGDREQFASLDFWITDCLTWGVHLVSNMIWFVHRIEYVRGGHVGGENNKNIFAWELNFFPKENSFIVLLLQHGYRAHTLLINNL